MAKIQAVFFDRRSRKLETVWVNLPTRLSGLQQATRIACNDHAWDNGYTHWAAPSLVDDGGTGPLHYTWQIFACAGRSSRKFLTEKPTKEAAEMWLVHLG